MSDESPRTRHPLQSPAVQGYSRRDVTLALVATGFGAALPRGVIAQASASAVNALTIVYPTGTFNFDYYASKHLKLIASLYGASLERVELRRVISPPLLPGATVPPLPFSAVVNIWLKDPDAFLASMEKHNEALSKDVPRFTNVTPTIQFDTVQGAMGAARSVPKIGDRCLTMLFPNGDQVRWDAEKYRTSHMPLIMSLYGMEAIRRFEVRKGDHGTAGSKPTYIGLANIYVADQAAMQAAGRKHGARLMAENANFSSVDPIAFPSIIHALA